MVVISTNRGFHSVIKFCIKGIATSSDSISSSGSSAFSSGFNVATAAAGIHRGSLLTSRFARRSGRYLIDPFRRNMITKQFGCIPLILRPTGFISTVGRSVVMPPLVVVFALLVLRRLLRHCSHNSTADKSA